MSMEIGIGMRRMRTYLFGLSYLILKNQILFIHILVSNQYKNFLSKSEEFEE